MNSNSYTRRAWLEALTLSASYFYLPTRAFCADDTPTHDPLADYKLEWTKSLPWATVVDVTRVPGVSLEDRLANAQALVVGKGGGVVYFPAGVYTFKESVKLLQGVILRGAPPGTITRAQHENYVLSTKFVFPKYEAKFTGEGTPTSTAFKGIYLAEPAHAANVGLLHLDINHGHVHFQHDGTEKCTAGKNRFVVGCILRNAAVADPSVPNLKIGQKPWQRFTARHHAAIDVSAQANLLVANNRLPKSGDDNFTMAGYVLLDTKKKETTIDGVVFDFDNRPGLYVNHFGIGGAGGGGPDGTPETHPHGFRTGIVIRDNYVYNTGRMGIGFCGDGVKCLHNTIRIPDDVWRPTATGQQLTSGASTNDNRAIEMRGWRWHVEGNDYSVHRNWAFDKKYKINDGEGLMHEDHVNSTIKESVLVNNRGNTYLSLYKTAGIEGLLVEGNEIKLGDGKQTIASGTAIYVDANRNQAKFPCKKVSILKNTVAGGGILLAGNPAEGNVIAGNKHLGGKAKLIVRAAAKLENNEGFEVTES